MVNETGQVGQNRKTREVCVYSNSDTFNRRESTMYYEANGRGKMVTFIPYAFKIEEVPNVGGVVLIEQTTGVGYHMEDGDLRKRYPHVTHANVAGLLTSPKETTDEY